MKLTINGKEQDYQGEEDRPLLWYLREDLKLTGTKFGCGEGLCGACTVLIDACMMSVAMTLGAEITRVLRVSSCASRKSRVTPTVNGAVMVVSG